MEINNYDPVADLYDIYVPATFDEESGPFMVWVLEEKADRDFSMSPKVLRRCSICKKFHAAYVVEDPQLGKLHLCLSCWKARQVNAAPLPQQGQETAQGDEKETELP